MHLVTAKEMQQMDARTIDTVGIEGRVLMENAARGALSALFAAFPSALGHRIGVMVGRGNNGGDGCVMARYLAQWGADVSVFLLTDPARLQGDALHNYELLERLGVRVRRLPHADAFKEARQSLKHRNLWIDAILGTGLKSPVRGFFVDAIDFLNESGKPVFSVDLPSGLDADTGQPLGTCVKAAATATFGFAKIGHVLHPGATLSGRVFVVDIGIPDKVSGDPPPGQRLITRQWFRTRLVPRPGDTHKGRTGHLLVVAGSPGKTGAAAMCADAAMRAGAGLVTLGVPERLLPVMETKATEVMTLPLAETPTGAFSEAAADTVLSLLKENRKCLAIGPGLGTDPQTGRLVNRLLSASPVPVVVDADGLNLLSSDVSVLSRVKAPVVLTPHPGEMARLTGLSTSRIQADRVEAARAFATRWRVHVILKGAATVIASPDGQVAINATGNAGMASGGMGDVLTGLVAGLITQGYDPADACAMGVFIHGAAADLLARDLGPIGYVAGDLLKAVPRVIAQLTEPSPDRPDLFLKDPFVTLVDPFSLNP